MTLDLTDEEIAALTRLLRDGKLRPEPPPREPLPPLKTYAPPARGRYRGRR